MSEHIQALVLVWVEAESTSFSIHTTQIHSMLEATCQSFCLDDAHRVTKFNQQVQSHLLDCLVWLLQVHKRTLTWVKLVELIQDVVLLTMRLKSILSLEIISISWQRVRWFGASFSTKLADAGIIATIECFCLWKLICLEGTTTVSVDARCACTPEVRSSDVCKSVSLVSCLTVDDCTLVSQKLIHSVRYLVLGFRIREDLDKHCWSLFKGERVGKV